MITTKRLELLPCDESHFEAVLQSEVKLAELLNITIAKDWMPFPESLPFGYEMLKADSQNFCWGMYLFIHKADQKLVGSGGYTGKADENGMVEIGYSISTEYQNQGLATEAAKGFIKFAFSFQHIKTVEAHTLAEENVSTKVLKKCGLTKITEKYDEKDGDIWQWRILKEDFKRKPTALSRLAKVIGFSKIF